MMKTKQCFSYKIFIIKHYLLWTNEFKFEQFGYNRRVYIYVEIMQKVKKESKYTVVTEILSLT